MPSRAAKPWLDDGDVQLYQGDCIEVLRSLPAGIAQTCVTSPPYWGLRDYGTGTWTGGDATCDHIRTTHEDHAPDRPRGWDGAFRNTGEPKPVGYGDTCGKCGARRTDDQLGLEATPDLYVERMVAVFREVRRVLRDDGTLWLNLGDSYISGQGGRQSANGELPSTSRFDRPDPKARPDLPNAPAGWAERAVTRRTYPGADSGYKPKDLAGMPWRVAFALQADGWYLRSDIIWAKPNPMPESVTDRPTKSHEYLFLFSKQPRYFYDADAIREPHQPDGRGMTTRTVANGSHGNYQEFGHEEGRERWPNGGRNRRSVWTIPTEPFPEAHFATYPQALVTPCIQAGTSERGGCAECGEPWRRVVERESLQSQERWSGSGRGNGVMAGGGHYGRTGQWSTTTTERGWEPSCACLECGGSGDTQPQLVLDPFIGSGTTALVARKHGRRCIGIDLSLDYLAIAAKRTQQLSLLGLDAGRILDTDTPEVA